MKAVVTTKYGSPDMLELMEIEKPTPKDNEVLIRVYATTVTAGDCEARSFEFPILFWVPLRLYMGIRRPRLNILGQELAGEIEAVGKTVTQFKTGDKIFAATLMRFGAYAEYVCLPETYPIVHKPEDITFDEAATIPTGGINGLHFINKANVQAGEKILINGAGGSIGTYAVQIANSLGAEVTVVDSKEKFDMMQSIGADHTIDYTEEDFTRNHERYDVIIDVVGKISFSRAIRSLRQNGRYILGNPSLSNIIRGFWISKTTDRKVLFELAGTKKENLIYLGKLVGNGTIQSVLDRHYTLEQTAEAHVYVDDGHKQGNVAIIVNH